MRYRPKSAAALEIALGGLPNSMGVEAEPDLGVSAKTVGELRKTKTWPENWRLRHLGNVIQKAS